MKKLIPLVVLLTACNTKNFDVSKQDETHIIETGDSFYLEEPGTWYVMGMGLRFTDSVTIPPDLIANRCGKTSTSYQLTIHNETDVKQLGHIVARGQGQLPADDVFDYGGDPYNDHPQQVSNFTLGGRGMLFAADHVQVIGDTIRAEQLPNHPDFEPFVLINSDGISCAFSIEF